MENLNTQVALSKQDEIYIERIISKLEEELTFKVSDTDMKYIDKMISVLIITRR